MAYGFEVYRQDGSKLISSTDGVSRLIYAVTIASNFSGNVSLPKFDSDLGFWTSIPYITRWRRSLGVWHVVGNTENWVQSGAPIGQSIGFRPPATSWNNATKVMTFTENTENNGFPFASVVLDRNPDYFFKFIHYR